MSSAIALSSSVLKAQRMEIPCHSHALLMVLHHLTCKEVSPNVQYDLPEWQPEATK